VELDRQLKNEGTNAEELRKKETDKLIIREYLGDKVGRRIVITPADIKRYYDDNISTFSQAPTVEARVIYLSFSRRDPDEAEKLANAIYEDIKAGRFDFADRAKEYSSDAKAQEGGNWGAVSQPQFVKEVDEVLFNLKAGEFSKPIRTSRGFWLVKAEKVQGGEVRPMEKVQEDIRKAMEKQQWDKLVSELYKELFANAIVRSVWE
jgi:parvulin-like peptidyl-prolyl isomerase